MFYLKRRKTRRRKALRVRRLFHFKVPRSLATYAFLALIAVSCDSNPERELANIFGVNFLEDDSSAQSSGTGLSASEVQQLESTLGTKKPWKIGFPALKNKRPDVLLQTLGGPDFVRQDGKSQIWQYRSSDCILDIFIHGPQKNLKIIHSEIRGRAVGSFPNDNCITNLIISKVKQKHALLVEKIKQRSSEKYF